MKEEGITSRSKTRRQGLSQRNISLTDTPRKSNISRRRESGGKQNDLELSSSINQHFSPLTLSLLQSGILEDVNDSPSGVSTTSSTLIDEVDDRDEDDSNSKYTPKLSKVETSLRFGSEHSFESSSPKDSGGNISNHSGLSQIIAQQQMMLDSAKKKKNWYYLKKTVKKILPGRKKQDDLNYSIDTDDMQEGCEKNQPYEGPTPFHTACYSSSSLQHIEKCCSMVPIEDRRKVDMEGRSPLALIFKNRTLAKSLQLDNHFNQIESFHEKKLDEVVAFALSTLNPSECEQPHFTWDVFTEWIDMVDSHIDWRAESGNKWFSVISNLQKQSKRLTHQSSHTDAKNQSFNDADINVEHTNTNSSSIDELQEGQSVELPLQINFALQLLSGMIEKLNTWYDLNQSFYNNSIGSPRNAMSDTDTISESRPQRKMFSRRKKKHNKDSKLQNGMLHLTMDDHIHQNPHEYISKLVKSFASTPNLMKTFLLIDDAGVRKKLFEIDVVRRAMLSNESVKGSWLSEMLQHYHRKRATEYLMHLSQLSTEEARKAEQTSDEEMKLKLKELCQAIGDLEGFLPSMLAIDNRDIEDLATTPMIIKVLDEMITMPFANTLFFFDFFLLGLLIFFFRSCVDSYLLRQEAETVLRWFYATLFSAFHFQMRAIGRIVSLVSMTRNVSFRSSILFNIWTILHMACLFMVGSCIIEIRFSAPLGKNEYLLDNRIRSQFAITTLLLWFNLLGLMKSMNVKLATFVSAIVQIVNDVFWYVVLIIGMVLCFSQVFYTLLIPSDCVDKEGINGCRAAEFYLKVYSVLLGELDEELLGGIENTEFGKSDEELLQERFALILFFVFSFIMAIVMLNILIAVISDSYEKTMVKSRKLFGRARLHQLAEILALQDLFRVRGDNKISNRFFNCKWTSFEWTKGGFTFFLITTCGYVLWAVIDIGTEIAPTLRSLSILVFSLNLVMFGIFLFLLASAAQNNNNKVTFGNCFVRAIHKGIQSLMVRLMGKSQDALLHDQWDGRLMFIKGEIASSAKNVNSSIENIQQELKSDERQILDFKKELNGRIDHIQEQMDLLLKMSTRQREPEDRMTI